MQEIQGQKFKRVNFNEDMERYLIFKLTPEKKLLNIIQDLKAVFPQHKRWLNLVDDKEQKEKEILEKFRKKAQLYKKICQYWLNNNTGLATEFNEYFQNVDKEVHADDVIKFFDAMKKKHSLNSKDIIVFIHIYVEQAMGVQLFEESALKIEKELQLAS